MHRIDDNDLTYVRRLGLDVVAWAPCPRSEGGAINPQVTRFALADGRFADVVHVKPVYYETQEGFWRPLSEVCSHHGNRRIAIRPDRVSWVHPRFLLWLMKRQRLFGEELAFWSPGYSGVQPRHLMWADTLTAYPDPNPETTTVDGNVQYSGTGGATWATVHDAVTGTGRTDDSSYLEGSRVQISGGNYLINRGFLLFNTAALTAGATGISATVSLARSNIATTNGDNDGDDWVNIFNTNPASNTALATADYDQCGDAVTNPTEGSTRIDTGSLAASTNTYSDWALNASGLTWINQTGVTKLGTREGHDCINSAVVANNNWIAWCAENSGTSADPKLVITYTPPPPGSLPFDTLRTFLPLLLR